MYDIWHRYPNTETVRELIFKRGQTKIDGKKVALNNAVVEEHLGKFKFF